MPTSMNLPGVTFVGSNRNPLPSGLLAGLTKGPIAFWEPGNPNQPLPWDPAVRTTYVPANGSTVPNLARTNGLATATVGSDPGDFTVANTMNNAGVKTKVERTKAGGIHFLASQTNQDTTYETFRTTLGAPTVTYLNANLGDDLYLGFWYRQTRPLNSTTLAAQVVGVQKGDPNGNTGDRWITAGPSGTTAHYVASPPIGDGRSVGGVTVIDDTAASGLMFLGLAATNGPASFVAIDRFLNLGASSAGYVNKYPSLIPYRAYLEDLTQSGRSFSTVVGIDQGEFVAACQTSGGRYYADTLANGAYSNPATVLP